MFLFFVYKSPVRLSFTHGRRQGCVVIFNLPQADESKAAYTSFLFHWPDLREKPFGIGPVFPSESFSGFLHV